MPEFNAVIKLEKIENTKISNPSNENRTYSYIQIQTYSNFYLFNLFFLTVDVSIRPPSYYEARRLSLKVTIGCGDVFLIYIDITVIYLSEREIKIINFPYYVLNP